MLVVKSFKGNKMTRNAFVLSVIAVAIMSLGFASKTYKYRCPKCKLIQEYAIQGSKKCPNDGSTMIRMP